MADRFGTDMAKSATKPVVASKTSGIPGEQLEFEGWRSHKRIAMDTARSRIDSPHDRLPAGRSISPRSCWILTEFEGWRFT